MKKQGKVYIIGAGPGDPGLITVRGMECLKRSDVIVYDYLVSMDILKYTRKDARLIYVGKKGGDHTVPQENLNQILVKQLKNRYSDPSYFKRFVVGIDKPKMRLYDTEQSAQDDILDSGQENIPDKPLNTFGNRESKFNRNFSGLKV